MGCDLRAPFDDTWPSWRSIEHYGDASSCEARSFAVVPMGRTDLPERSVHGISTAVIDSVAKVISQRIGCRAKSHFPGSVEKKIELPILYVAQNHEELHRRDHQKS